MVLVVLILNHLADLWWITNEYELGDFGMGGAYVKRNGYITPTKIFTESILKEYGVKWIKQAGVKKIQKVSTPLLLSIL